LKKWKLSRYDGEMVKERKNKKYALIDIGNSTVLIAEYQPPELRRVQRISTKNFGEAQVQALLKKGYDKIFLASVVPALNPLFPKSRKIHFVSYKNIPGIQLNLSRPQDVGADRIVNALAAFQKYQKPCLIIDSGTATTFCYIDANGIYQGGAIFPGLLMASKSLHDYTAKIPEIWVKETPDLFGKTTEEAVQSGIFQGFIALINGTIKNFKAQTPEILIVGTGSGLEILKKYLDLDHYDPDLIIEGLKICADYTKHKERGAISV